MNRNRIEKVRGLIGPAVEAEGLELFDIEFTGAGKGALLRVYVDKAGGVTVEDCATVSRQIDLLLEAEDDQSRDYTLEVSSPGLTRPLKKPADYQRAIGLLALITLRTSADGFTDRKLLCVIDSADDQSVTVTLKDSGDTAQIDYADIAKARLEVEF